MGLSFKIISMSSSIGVPNCMLLPQNPQFCHYFAPFCWTIDKDSNIKVITLAINGNSVTRDFTYVDECSIDVVAIFSRIY